MFSSTAYCYRLKMVATTIPLFLFDIMIPLAWVEVLIDLFVVSHLTPRLGMVAIQNKDWWPSQVRKLWSLSLTIRLTASLWSLVSSWVINSALWRWKVTGRVARVEDINTVTQGTGHPQLEEKSWQSWWRRNFLVHAQYINICDDCIDREKLGRTAACIWWY